MNLQTTAGNS